MLPEKGVVDLTDEQYSYLLKKCFWSRLRRKSTNQGREQAGVQLSEAWLCSLEDEVLESFHQREQVSGSRYAFDDALSRIATKPWRF
jgi:hypothetical protein